MAGAVFALLVGIDTYDGVGVARLQGCANDIRRMKRFLETRVSARDLHLVTLLDADATRSAVVEGWRTHLTKARAGDVALFCFSGHGSRERTTPSFWFREPDGMNSTIVCVDSRSPGARAWDLSDKELGALLDVVAAFGPHVLVILDSCHSGGGTRGVVLEEAAAAEAHLASGPIVTAVRELEPIDDERPLDSYLEEVQRLADQPVPRGAPRDIAGVGPGSGRHVAMFACEAFQQAREIKIKGETRGAFSSALESALGRLGPAATYQDVMVAVRNKVTEQVRDQFPLLFTMRAEDNRLGFLGGTLTPASGAFTLVHGANGWSIDGGSCHGVAEPVGDETTVLAVLEPHRAHDVPNVLATARVVTVDASTSRVKLDQGTTLDQSAQYPVVVVGTPLPPAEVVVSGASAAAERIRAGLSSAGPGETSSPHLRVVEAHRGDGLQLDVVADADQIRILRPDGSRVTADVEGTDNVAVATVVNRLEHIARWDQIRRLENPRSALTGNVRAWLALGDFEELAPTEIALLRARRLEPDQNGIYRLSYGHRTVEASPSLFIVLENDTPREVFVALLDLTDRFKMHANLGDGTWLYPGKPMVAWSGYAVGFTIPEARLQKALRDGTPAVVRDWLKLIASEQRFETSSFSLPPLDEPVENTRSVAMALSTIDRIAGRALTRDGSDRPPPGGVADWSTLTLEVVTQLPAPR